MEGIKHQRNALYVVHNTLVYQNHRTTSCFVRVEKTPEGFRPVILNNVCVGAIPLSNIDNIEAGGNLLLRSVAEAGFVDPAAYDYRLEAGSPCIDKAAPLGKVDDRDLKPKFQYVHPAKAEPRPVVGLLDVGALEYAPPGTMER
jgi:hypothetical protein